VERHIVRRALREFAFSNCDFFDAVCDLFCIEYHGDLVF